MCSVMVLIYWLHIVLTIMREFSFSLNYFATQIIICLVLEFSFLFCVGSPSGAEMERIIPISVADQK